MVTRTLVIELCRRAIKDGSPVVTWIAGQRSLTQPRLSANFGPLSSNAYTIAV